ETDEVDTTDIIDSVYVDSLYIDLAYVGVINTMDVKDVEADSGNVVNTKGIVDAVDVNTAVVNAIDDIGVISVVGAIDAIDDIGIMNI
ncbi:11344_t:CDS:2, partial [Racocetra persica]